MERINPINFNGPRAYITDFDYQIVRFKHDREAYRKEVERRLKILLLTKNIVVFAASHMTHEFTYNFLKINPFLLEENMIIPALRRDKQHITDYLDDKRTKKSLKESMKDFYEDYVSEVVDWELVENAAWFRAKFLKALRDERSVIRRNLPNLSKRDLDSLLSEIESNEILNHKIILESTSSWPTKKRKSLLNFEGLVYHLSGARVVNCETALPQENYIDYSLTDFSEHRVALSDTQVFLKIFFEMAFETLCQNALPGELLDVLSFEDINYIRTPIEESSFRKKYDELISKSIQIVKKPEIESESLVYDIEKPIEILEQISKTFEEIFKQELPEFLKKKHKEKTTGLYKSTVSLGTGVVGLVPGFGNVSKALSLLKSSRESYINLNQYLRSKKEIDNYDLYLKHKKKLLRQLIENTQISEKSVLLDTLDLLVGTISMKTKL